MSTRKTQPEIKGFFEKIRATIEQFWGGTKKNAEGLKEKAGDNIEDIKESVTAKKAATTKKAVAAKTAVTKNVADNTNKARKETANLNAKDTTVTTKKTANAIKAKAATKANPVTGEAKKEIDAVKKTAAPKIAKAKTYTAKAVKSK